MYKVPLYLECYMFIDMYTVWMFCSRQAWDGRGGGMGVSSYVLMIFPVQNRMYISSQQDCH